MLPISGCAGKPEPAERKPNSVNKTAGCESAKPGSGRQNSATTTSGQGQLSEFVSYGNNSIHAALRLDCDIDLRLVCGNTMTVGALYELSHELEKELGRKVDIVTNPPEHMRPPFRKSIEQDEVAEHNILGIGARKNLTLQHRRPCLATDRHRVRFETLFIRNLNTKIIVVYLSF